MPTIQLILQRPWALAVLSLTLILTGCNTENSPSSSGTDDTPVDTEEEANPPALNIDVLVDFPPALSLIDGISQQITVRGSLNSVNNEAISRDDFSQLLINGEAVTFDTDEPSQWSSTLAVEQGENDLSLVLTGNEGQEETTSHVFYNAPVLTGAYRLHYQENSQQLFVLDVDLDGVYVADIDELLFSEVSGSSVGAGDNFSNPSDFAVDTDTQKIYVAESQLKQIVEVDLATGNRSVLSSNSVGTGEEFIRPYRMVLDKTRNRILVSEYYSSTLRVLAVSLIDGSRSIVSDNISVGTGDPFQSMGDMVLSADLSGVYMIESAHGKVTFINATNGNRSILSSSSIGLGPNLTSPHYLKLDADSNLLFVADAANKALYSVSTTSGNRTEVSSETVGGGYRMLSYGDFAMLDSDTLFEADFNTDAFVEIDVESGARTEQAFVHMGTGDKFYQAWDMEWDSTTRTLFVIGGDDDNNAELTSVDIATGNQTIIASNTVGTGTTLPAAFMFELDTVNQRAIVTDEDLLALVEVELETGNRAILSDDSKGTGLSFTGSTDVVIGQNGNQAYVADDGIYDVNLTTGDRTLLSGDSAGTGDAFDYVSAMVLDEDNEQLIVIDEGNQSILSVSLNSATLGNRLTISDSITGSGTELDQPVGLALDATENRVFVSDQNLNTVFSINLITGNRTVISDATTGNGVQNTELVSLIFDEENQLLYGVISDINAIAVIDVTTGDRAIISM